MTKGKQTRSNLTIGNIVNTPNKPEGTLSVQQRDLVQTIENTGGRALAKWAYTMMLEYGMSVHTVRDKLKLTLAAIEGTLTR